VYNYFLNCFNTTKRFNRNEYKTQLPELKRQLEWLKFPNAQSLQSAVDNLGDAIWRFRKGLTDAPVFKKKHRKNSFEVPQCWEIQTDRLHIPKLETGRIWGLGDSKQDERE
jgi:putative transposase